MFVDDELNRLLGKHEAGDVDGFAKVLRQIRL